MSFDVDVVVFSNINKGLPPGVELRVVDMRGANPCSLPFAHRQVMAERVEDYDLFVYTEDDTLIEEKNLCAFLELSEVLAETEIAGFFRFERSADGSLSYPEVHGHFHWAPESVRTRGEYVLAHFTNEHSACFALTQRQLRRVIRSGRFLVPPHSSKYDLICSAGTDPYTQCGLEKLICISHLDRFSIHHLSDKYVKTGWGASARELSRQISALLRLAKNANKSAQLFDTETKLIDGWYSKDYYEPVQTAAVALIPEHVRSVLSIGCGWGATEVWLREKGLSVTAAPLDPLIPGGAEAHDVEIIPGGLSQVRKLLANRRFDCLLLSNVLHLVADPVDILSSFGALLSPGGVAIAVVPHATDFMTAWKTMRKSGSLFPRFSALSAVWTGIRKGRGPEDASTYRTMGFHVASPVTVRQWFLNSGMRIERFIPALMPPARRFGRLVLGLLDLWLAREFVVVGRMLKSSVAGEDVPHRIEAPRLEASKPVRARV